LVTTFTKNFVLARLCPKALPLLQPFTALLHSGDWGLNKALVAIETRTIPYATLRKFGGFRPESGIGMFKEQRPFCTLKTEF
jgi:hypothetical protein